MTTFVDKLQAGMLAKKSVLCVGLDPQLKFIPPHLIEQAIAKHGKTWTAVADCFFEFNRGIIDAIVPYASCVKPNAAFYEGSDSLWRTYERTIAYAHSQGLLVINDGKRFDGGDTADVYAQAHIGELPFFDNTTISSLVRSDAVTIGGYIGEDTIARFLKEMKQHGTGAFVVTKTSFKPNSVIEQLIAENGMSVWEELANHVGTWGEGVIGDNGYSNLGVVMGATYPDDAKRMKEILPKCVKLVPGYGAQGGGADDAVVSFNDDGFGAIVVSARAIMTAWKDGEFKINSEKFAFAAAQAAAKARNELSVALEQKPKY